MVDFNVTYDGRSYPFRLPDDQFDRFKNLSKADQRKRIRSELLKRGVIQDTPPQQDTSFGSAFRYGFDQPTENFATTARALGMEGTADTLSGLVDAPENYQSASDRFINPQEGDFTVGGFAPGYLPRATVEQAGQYAGSILSRAGGAAAGGAIAGPPGAVAGAIGGPALFEALQQLGPVAYARAQNNGRQEPEFDDWLGAATTAGATGLLNALGVMGPAGLKRVLAEGATEGFQSVAQQTGETALTDKGLEVSGRQAIGEGIIGGTSAGGVDAAVAGAKRLPQATRATVDAAGAAMNFRANREFRENPDQVESDLRVVDMFEAENAAIAQQQGGTQVAENVVFKNVQDRLKNQFSQLLDSMFAANKIGTAERKKLSGVISRAAKHNRELSAETDDVTTSSQDLIDGFESDEGIINSLDIDAEDKTTLLRALRDLNTITENGLAKRRVGLFETFMKRMGANVGTATGAMTGGPAGAVVGAEAGRSTLPRIGRAIDNVMGTTRPPVLRRYDARKKAAERFGRGDYGNTPKELADIIQKNLENAKAVNTKDQEGLSPQATTRNEYLNEIGAERQGGWLASVREYASNAAGAPVSEQDVFDAIEEFVNADGLSQEMMDDLVSNRGGQIPNTGATERLIYQITDLAVKRKLDSQMPDPDGPDGPGGAPTSDDTVSDASEVPPRLPNTPDNLRGPSATAHAAKLKYLDDKGFPVSRAGEYVEVDADRAGRIAQAFDDAEHRPDDPEVQAAYAAMIDETLEQFRYIEATGLEVEFITPDMDDPYGGSSSALIDDVRDNNHMWVYPTLSGFGDNSIQDNPLLAPTDITFKGQPATANDIFRVVHDYFGHVLEGNTFTARGEENAWQSHVRMYSPLAAQAMTTETRGQNSWVNFGPLGESNRANPSETVYAEQKVTLLPVFATSEGISYDNETNQAAQTPVGRDDLPTAQGAAPSPLSRAGQETAAEDVVSDQMALPPSAPQKSLLEFIQDNPDGFTIDTETGAVPAEGYAVAPVKQAEMIVAADDITDDVVDAYVEKLIQMAVSTGQTVYAGGWLNQDDNKYYLDATLVVDNVFDALYIAEAGDQIAIFDLGAGNVIQTEEGIAQLRQAGAYSSDAADVQRSNQEKLVKSFSEARRQGEEGVGALSDAMDTAIERYRGHDVTIRNFSPIVADKLYEILNRVALATNIRNDADGYGNDDPYMTFDDRDIAFYTEQADKEFPLSEYMLRNIPDAEGREVISKVVVGEFRGLSAEQIAYLATSLARLIQFRMQPLNSTNSVAGFMSPTSPYTNRPLKKVEGILSSDILIEDRRGDITMKAPGYKLGLEGNEELFTNIDFYHTLIHELGHIIEYRTGLRDELNRLMDVDPDAAREIRDELEALSRGLSDRFERTDQVIEQALLNEDAELEAQALQYMDYLRGTNELLAEGVATFMHDPVFAKKTAPKATEFIKEIVNTSGIKDILGFLSIGLLIGPEALMMAMGLAGEEEERNPGALTPSEGALSL